MDNEAMDSPIGGLPWTDPGLSITPRSGRERDVFAALADCFGIDKDEIKERTRRRDIVRPRQMIMYLLREYGGMSFPAIGRLVGNRDHTTVIHSYVKIKNEIAMDPRIIDFLSVPISIAGIIKGRKLRIEKQLQKLKEQIQLETKSAKRPKARPIPERNIKVLEMYREGPTLQNIAEAFGLTRERVRQIVSATIRQMAINESISKGIEMDFDVLMEEESKKRKDVQELKKGRSKSVATPKEKRWSQYYLACKKCGTTAFPHVRHGLCERCIGQFRGKRREDIIARHFNRCDTCRILRGDAIRKYGRDLYITKSQQVFCREHFLLLTGKRLGNRVRRKKVTA